MCVKLLNT